MVVRDLLIFPSLNHHQTFHAAGVCTVECPRGTDVRKYATAEVCTVNINNERPPFCNGESLSELRKWLAFLTKEI